MRFRVIGVALLASGLGAPGALAAQTMTVETSVTFLVPVNLTQLSPDLEKVRAICMVMSPAMTLTGLPSSATLPILMTEAPVVSGQVITTLRTEFLVYSGWLQNAVGQGATYTCDLQGFSKSLQRWDGFSDTAQDAVFRLKPTPPTIQGTFVW